MNLRHRVTLSGLPQTATTLRDTCTECDARWIDCYQFSHRIEIELGP